MRKQHKFFKICKHVEVFLADKIDSSYR